MRNARVGPWYDDFSKRLSDAIETKGISQTDLARRLSVSEAAVSRWRTGQIPEPELMPRVAAALGLSLEQLFGLKSMPRADRVADETPTYGASRPEPKRADDWHLPRVAFAAAGSPIDDVLQDDATVWYAFRRGWVKHMVGETGLKDEQRLVVIQVDRKHLGESMLPTIKPGALLVVDRGTRGQGISEQKDVIVGKVYLVIVDGGLTVKRVFFGPGSMILVADNPDRERYPPQLVPLKGKSLQDVVVGRVVWIGQEEV